MSYYSKSSKTTFFFSFILILFSCSSQEIQDQNHQIEIESIWDLFVESWHSQDAASCASIYLENGLNIAPEFPINQGREKIASFYDFLFSDHISSVYQHKILELTPSGADLIERGEFLVDWVRNDQSTWTYRARTLTHWTKDEKGNWKIKSLIFNQAPEK